MDADHQLLTYQLYLKLLNIVSILKLLRPAKVAHLATADSNLQPYITPVVFVIENNKIYIPLDHKPKTVPINQLKRVKNIRKTLKLLFRDNYEDDWQRLWFIMLIGYAELVEQKEVGGIKINIFAKFTICLWKNMLRDFKVEIGTIFIKISSLKGFYWHYNTSKQ